MNMQMEYGKGGLNMVNSMLMTLFHILKEIDILLLMGKNKK
jgi:hypothetical protein